MFIFLVLNKGDQFLNFAEFLHTDTEILFLCNSKLTWLSIQLENHFNYWIKLLIVALIPNLKTLNYMQSKLIK